VSETARELRLDQAEATEGKLRWANIGSVLFAFLQSICAAVLAISGFSGVVGLTSLAAASGVISSMKAFHRDEIRIPMMVLALAGALANLYVVWRVRSLRVRPAAQWRVQPVSPEKLRSERLQTVLAVLTLILLASEWLLHWWLHHRL
jgi:hypothetical protein